MEAKEKAKELVEKFHKQKINAQTLHMKRNNPDFRMDFQAAKSCAIICCDEILASEQAAYPYQKIETGQVFKEFWQSVKKEVNNL